MRLKYAAKPVVATPFGMALGGGAEMVMHSFQVAAQSELHMGLVEAGVGVIPGSGGCKELLARAVERYALSMRGYTRLIKVARTIADLRGEADISAPAMAEAIQYRMLDAKYWSR